MYTFWFTFGVNTTDFNDVERFVGYLTLFINTNLGKFALRKSNSIESNIIMAGSPK